MYNYYFDMCSSMYAYFDDIYLSFMDDAWKKEKLSFVQNWHSHAFIDIQIQCTNLGGVLHFR
jgi:hypothetical protein